MSVRKNPVKSRFLKFGLIFTLLNNWHGEGSLTFEMNYSLVTYLLIFFHNFKSMNSFCGWKNSSNECLIVFNKNPPSRPGWPRPNPVSPMKIHHPAWLKQRNYWANINKFVKKLIHTPMITGKFLIFNSDKETFSCVNLI